MSWGIGSRIGGPRPRRPRGFRPEAERVEGRTLLSAMGRARPAAEGDVAGSLAAFSDSGVPGDGVTNVSRPTFIGTGQAWATVQLFAIQAGSSPTNTRLMGQAIVGGDGAWSINSTSLPDGTYTVTAVQTPARSSPDPPIALADALTIDTVGPRVAGLAFAPQVGSITAVISDEGSGVNTTLEGEGTEASYDGSARNPANYTVVPPATIRGANPNQSGLTSSPAISGFYSDASAYTVQVDFGAGLGSRWARGRYLFQIRSGGVTDLAGNALDGEFTGSLPSGDGVPGGNFIANLTNNLHVRRRPPRRR